MSPKHTVTSATVVFFWVVWGFAASYVTIKAGCVRRAAKSVAHAKAGDSGSGLM